MGSSGNKEARVLGNLLATAVQKGILAIAPPPHTDHTDVAKYISTVHAITVIATSEEKKRHNINIAGLKKVDGKNYGEIAARELIAYRIGDRIPILFISDDLTAPKIARRADKVRTFNFTEFLQNVSNAGLLTAAGIKPDTTALLIGINQWMTEQYDAKHNISHQSALASPNVIAGLGSTPFPAGKAPARRDHRMRHAPNHTKSTAHP